MGMLPRSPYVVTLIGVAVVLGLAWTGRGRYRLIGPGTPAPSFTASTLSGDTVTLEGYPDRVILLNIWATWCPPCREEMPSMERLHRRQRERGVPFEILAVSIDAAQGESDALGNPGGDLQAFAKELDLTFTILHDPTGRIQRTYRTTGVPESFLIGRDGIIFRRLVGAVEWDTPEWDATIRRLAGGRPTPPGAADSTQAGSSAPSITPPGALPDAGSR
ncbi:MAG: TlpA disulfide reductase family protein [Longimicrobiales bacterium]|nr:TlpA disulfide reductase family protein [Longimicrobiales bacterium]